MTNTVTADASPEKRLFISLITRDISLADAVLDVIDNSINAAIEPFSSDLRTTADYESLLTDPDRKPTATIKVTIAEDKIVIEDDACGISLATAQKHVFKFGRSTDEESSTDRLSVYGIGLKRAIFKIGNGIKMTSDHAEGGFSLSLDVKKWEKIKTLPWTFDLLSRPAAPQAKRGTKIEISELYPDVKRRVSDGLFVEQLRTRISRTYAFFIGRIVNIELNTVAVEATVFQFGDNSAGDEFEAGSVSCSIKAGIAIADGKNFKQENAGWFVFCNGRTVIYADKGNLTGWIGGGAALPLFQPKHRPFLGIVFFVSENAEALPWTTTKASVNEESAVWQDAKRRMISVGKEITSFLDGRYKEDGTEVQPEEVRDASGTATHVLKTVSAPVQRFVAPKREVPETIRIQYTAKKDEVDQIARHLRRPSMGGAEVGRYTFDYFLRNRVKSDA